MIYNQRHPIALYSQPDRRGALHNKFDLTQSHGVRDLKVEETETRLIPIANFQCTFLSQTCQVC